MRFLNTAKLGLVLITVLVALVAVSEARADQPPSAAVSAVGAVAPVAVPAVTPTSPTSPGAAGPPAAPAPATNPPSDTTAPATSPADTTTPATSPADTTAPAPSPADTTAPPADTTAPPTDTTSSIGSTASSDTTAPTDTTERPTAPAPQNPPASPAPATPPTPPTPPATASPPPAPVASGTTTQVIVQIQISGCTSNCQGVSQVQQATQTTGYLQTAGASAQQASQLESPAPATPSQPTTTITQVQIGCLAQCFGTTTTSTAPQPVAQQILAELSSLMPPTASTGPQPSPGIDQAVIDQISCQLQTGGPAPGTEVQTATQTSTTLQLIAPSSGSQPTSVNQTNQQTWQLQIGCLFYCTDTEQVQQAQQAITTIQILVGEPGSTATTSTTFTTSTTGADAATSQLIWQLQIGCIAWCYDATQVQSASSQTTVTVITLVPPASPPPAPPPPAPLPPDTTDNPPLAPAIPASTASPPTTATPAATATPLLFSAPPAGVAILGAQPFAPGQRRRPVAGAVVPATGRSEVIVSTVLRPASRSERFRSHSVLVARPGRPLSAHPHRDLRALGATESLSTASIEAVPARPGSIPSILYLALGLVAATALWAFGRGHHIGRRR